MFLHERNNAIKHIFEKDCMPILETKGADYMQTDAYDQFVQLADMMGLTPVQIMYIYMSKHLKALQTAMSGTDLQGEKLEEKLKDIINYSFIMLAYLDQEE